MTARLMIQGAGSNVGKSMLVAGLCRAYRRRGLSVLPFKPQNMSNNAAVTVDGGEIGRAQALQALACGVEPVTDMNPVLLKPETETGAQVVVQGQRIATVKARDYACLKPTLMPAVLESFERLRASADLVLVEGAGSPAEVNLRAGDIANMGFAEAADVPVVLVGDIDRGGVIAQLVGSKVVLNSTDAARIKGFIINKFRGDTELFADGYSLIEAQTGWRGFGIAPWFGAASKLPAEDAQDLVAAIGTGALKIVCPVLSRISNFDDLDPLAQEPSVRLELIPAGQPLPGDAQLVILPGSKSTIGDLRYFREQGWDIDLHAHVRRGGAVLGLCGGYQMLGRRLSDPDGIEGPRGETEGLGLLDVATIMSPDKRLVEVEAIHLASGTRLRGYEMHIGQSEGPDRANPFSMISGRPEGAVAGDGQIMGTYLHGIFASDSFRAAFLAGFGHRSDLAYGAVVERTLDALAEHLEAHLDLDGLLELARSESSL